MVSLLTPELRPVIQTRSLNRGGALYALQTALQLVLTRKFHFFAAAISFLCLAPQGQEARSIQPFFSLSIKSRQYLKMRLTELQQQSRRTRKKPARKQKQQQQTIQKSIKIAGLCQPEHVQNRQNRHNINQPVQAAPATSQAPNHSVGRGQCQGQ